MSEEILSVISSYQNIYLNPHEGDFFEHDNVNSKLYLSRKISSTLNIYGDDCIINGLYIKNISFENYIISFEIEKGIVIIDQTLIEYLNNEILSMDVENLDDSGYLIITLSYNFYNTSYSNLSKFKIFHFSENNNCKDFYPENDRVILGKILFNKDENTYLLINNGEIILNQKEYIIRKNNLIQEGLNNIIEDICHLQ